MHETSVDTSLHSTGELVLPLDPNTEGHSPPCDVLPTNDGPKDGPAHTQNMAPNTGHTCPICPTKSFATSTILWQHINNSHAVRSIFTPQLAGEARQLGCPKIVLDHVRVYIYIFFFNICLCAPQCLSTRCIGNT